MGRVQTRVRGKVFQVIGGYGFEAEVTANLLGKEAEEALVVKSKFPFATKAQAEEALKHLGDVVLGALAEKAGPENVVYYEKGGKLPAAQKFTSQVLELLEHQLSRFRCR